MKNGTCSTCSSVNADIKLYLVDKLSLDDRSIKYTDPGFAVGGYFESQIANKDTLVTIKKRVEKLGDWQQVR